MLDILSERVGPTGHVIGIERNRQSVVRAKHFVHDRTLTNVAVIQGDASATGLPGDTFDLVHARLLLVNVPYVEAVVREMFRLSRPGGVVASHEADYIAHFCDGNLMNGGEGGILRRVGSTGRRY